MAFHLRREVAVNLFIGWVLVAMLIDGLPTICLLHGRAKSGIDGSLDALGIQQGSWQLFAPQVDKVNTRISARIRYADGAEAHWQQPDWSTMSAWRKVRTFRHAEYYDSIRLDRNRPGWPSLAQYLSRTVPHPRGENVSAVQVVLTRQKATIPDPAVERVPASPFIRFEDKQEFFTWNQAP